MRLSYYSQANQEAKMIEAYTAEPRQTKKIKLKPLSFGQPMKKAAPVSEVKQRPITSVPVKEVKDQLQANGRPTSSNPYQRRLLSEIVESPKKEEKQINLQIKPLKTLEPPSPQVL